MAGFRELSFFLEGQARDVERRAAGIMRHVAVEVAREVIPATPVDTGLARGNWQATLNIPASQPTPRLDPGAVSAIQQADQVARSLQVRDTFYLVNRVPYISLLNAGWSVQAPPGYIQDAVDTGLRKGIARSRAQGLL